jgi:hypothetical protein
MTKSIISVQDTRRVVCLVAMLLLLVFPTFAAARPATDEPPPELPPPADLGDAPDSTNHFGMAMSAYSGVQANFPTVFHPAAPHGPRHLNPGAGVWLGPNITKEVDADLLPDQDGVRNIYPPNDDPNNDAADDGIPNGIVLPQCQQTDFDYIVTSTAAGNVYVNVWFDFNHDGDWADTLTCFDSEGAMVNVPEWAVQNQAVAVMAGGLVFTTPLFTSFLSNEHESIWMRITLAEQPVPAAVADGRGPADSYRTGETEDYCLGPIQGPEGEIVYQAVQNCND